MGIGSSILDRAKAGDLKTVYELIDKGVDVHERDELGWTLLHWAADQGIADLAKLLLEHAADVNSRTENGSTPLHCSAYRGHADVTILLLDSKADISAVFKDGGTPLHSAAFGGQVDTCSVLLDRGADVNAHVKDGGTPLHSAARGGQVLTSKLLIERQADLNSRTQDGGTPLHSAAMGGQSEVSRLLVDLGADINAMANNGATPLHAAAYCGQPDVTKLLIDLKATVNSKAKEAWTPLHSAARGGHLLVSKLLVDGGADIAVRTEDGRLPLDAAPKNALQLRSLLRGESVIVEEVCLTNPRVFEKDGFVPEKVRPNNRYSPSKFKKFYSTSPSKPFARIKPTNATYQSNGTRSLPSSVSTSQLSSSHSKPTPSSTEASSSNAAASTLPSSPSSFSFSSFVTTPFAKFVSPSSGTESLPTSQPPAPLTPTKSNSNGFNFSWPSFRTPPSSAPSTPSKKPSSYGTYPDSPSSSSLRTPSRKSTKSRVAYVPEYQPTQTYLPTVAQPTPLVRPVQPEVKHEGREWGCEICGFTNSEETAACYLCGAASPFSSNEMGGISDVAVTTQPTISPPSYFSNFDYNPSPPSSSFETSTTTTTTSSYSPFTPISYTNPSTGSPPSTSTASSYDVFSAFSTLPPLASSTPVITHLDYGHSIVEERNPHHHQVIVQESKIEREKPEGDYGSSNSWRDESRSKIESSVSDLGKDGGGSAESNTMLCPICTHMNTLAVDHNGHCDVCGCPLSGY